MPPVFPAHWHVSQPVLIADTFSSLVWKVSLPDGTPAIVKGLKPIEDIADELRGAESIHTWLRFGESMMGISLNHGVHAKVSTPVHLRKARTCYDHLAGEVAVKIYDSLCQQQWITENGSMITLSGIQYFHEMGIDVPSKHSRKICCACLDWSERRFHLGGYVGAALFSLYESKGWLTRHLGYREVTITEKGYAAFKTHFHI